MISIRVFYSCMEMGYIKIYLKKNVSIVGVNVKIIYHCIVMIQ